MTYAILRVYDPYLNPDDDGCTRPQVEWLRYNLDINCWVLTDNSEECHHFQDQKEAYQILEQSSDPSLVVAYLTSSPGRAFEVIARQPSESWQRANKAFQVAFGTTPMSVPFTARENPETCEKAVEYFLRHLYIRPYANSLSRKYPTIKGLLAWFNNQYPVIRR